jgi:hypothetical protein
MMPKHGLPGLQRSAGPFGLSPDHPAVIDCVLSASILSSRGRKGEPVRPGFSDRPKDPYSEGDATEEEQQQPAEEE